MKALLNFFGDTLTIVYLLAMALVSLGLNTAIFALTMSVYVLTRAFEMYTLLLGAYAFKIKAVLDRPLTPSDAPKGTVH